MPATLCSICGKPITALEPGVAGLKGHAHVDCAMLSIGRPTRAVVEGPSLPPDVAKPSDKAELLLDEAKKIVTGARRSTYGTPEDNFACIAELWEAYLQRRYGEHVRIDAVDVATMMILMKCARLGETPHHHDSAVDIAGYAACLARVQS